MEIITTQISYIGVKLLPGEVLHGLDDYSGHSDSDGPGPVSSVLISIRKLKGCQDGNGKR